MESTKCRFCGNELEIEFDIDDYSGDEQVYLNCKNCDVTTIISTDKHEGKLPDNFWTSCVKELEFNLEQGWSTDPIPKEWKEKCDACGDCEDCWQHEYRKEILINYAIEYYNSKRKNKT